MAKKNGSGNTTNGSAAAASIVVTAPAAADAEVAPAQQQLTPEILEKISALRTKIQLSVGQVVLAIMNLPRYRHQTLGDLMHVVLDPLMHDRVAIAYTRKPDQPAGPKANDEQSVAGIAIWATVSAEVDAKITEQVRAGVFPVRLASDDWTSGDMVWLLDVVAQDRAQATRVLTSFNQLSGNRPVKIHPIVARSVDPALLERMKAVPAAGEAEAPIPEPQGQA